MDVVTELLDICWRLLRIVEAQESALRQLDAVTDAEDAAALSERLAALQGAVGPRETEEG